MKWTTIPRKVKPAGQISTHAGKGGTFSLRDGLRKLLGSHYVVVQNERGHYGLMPATEDTKHAMRVGKNARFSQPELAEAYGVEPGDTLPVREEGGVYMILRPAVKDESAEERKART